jgi:hypothetical protein
VYSGANSNTQLKIFTENTEACVVGRHQLTRRHEPWAYQVLFVTIFVLLVTEPGTFQVCKCFECVFKSGWSWGRSGGRSRSTSGSGGRSGGSGGRSRSGNNIFIIVVVEVFSWLNFQTYRPRVRLSDVVVFDGLRPPINIVNL